MKMVRSGVLALVAMAVLTLGGCAWIGGLFGDDVSASFTVDLDAGNIVVSVTINDPEVTSYTIERSSDGGSTYSEVYSGSDAEYVDSDITLGTTYNYRVILVRSDNSTETLAAQSITVADSLDRPTGVAVNVTDSSAATFTVRISWSAVTDADYYKLYYSQSYDSSAAFFSDDSNFTEITAVGRVTDTVATVDVDDVTFDESERYFFFVRAFNSTVFSSFSTEEQSVVTAGPAQPPVVVTGEAVSAETPTIRISWEPGVNATGYRVYRFLSENGSYEDRFSVGDTVDSQTGRISFTDDTVSSDTTYWYRVVGTNQIDGPTTDDEIVAADFFGATAVEVTSPLSAPTNVTAIETSSGAEVSWTAPSGASAYRVYRDTEIDGSYENLVGEPGTNTYGDTTVRSGVTYYYKVSAVGSASSVESPLSDEASVSISIKITAPSSLSGTPLSARKVRLTWTASTSDAGDVRYSVEQREGTNWQATTVNNISATSAVIVNLSPSEAYPFRVFATDADGNLSNYSSTVTVSTLPAAPTPAVSDTTSTSVTLSWNSSAAATGYNVYRASSPDGTYNRSNNSLLSASTLTYEVGGLSRATTYYFKVTVQDANQNETNRGEIDSVQGSTLALAQPNVTSTSYNSSTNEIEVQWGAVSFAVGYEVQYSLDGGSSWEDATDGVVPSEVSSPVVFSPTGAVDGSVVRLRVRAVDGDANVSNWSDTSDPDAEVQVF